MSRMSRSKEKLNDSQCYIVLNEKKDDAMLVLDRDGQKTDKDIQGKLLEGINIKGGEKNKEYFVETTGKKQKFNHDEISKPIKFSVENKTVKGRKTEVFVMDKDDIKDKKNQLLKADESAKKSKSSIKSAKQEKKKKEEEGVEEEEEETEKQKKESKQSKITTSQKKILKTSKVSKAAEKEEEEEEEEEEEQQEESEEQMKKSKKSSKKVEFSQKNQIKEIPSRKSARQMQKQKKSKNEEEEKEVEEDEENEEEDKKQQESKKEGKKQKEDEEADEKGEEEEEEEDEGEKNTKQKKGKKTQEIDKKKGSKGKKKGSMSESEGSEQEEQEQKQEEEDNNEEGEEEGEEGDSGKKKKKSGKKASKGKKKNTDKLKIGQWNPNVQIIEKCKQFEGDSSEIIEDCCVKCNNKEVIRSCVSGNKKLLKKIMEEESLVSTYHETWGCDNDVTPLEQIFIAKDKEMLKIFLQGINSGKQKMAAKPHCTLKEIDTGYNDKYAYGVRTRKVQMGRGGKELNNAFVYDISENHGYSYLIQKLSRMDDIDIEMFKMIQSSIQEVQNSIDEFFGIAVKAGNFKLAGHLIKEIVKRGGFGFNKLHEEVLTAKSDKDLTEFKATSVTKKTMTRHMVSPIHCACINPNPDILEKLLSVKPEYSLPDEILRKPVHYAAACQGPGPLQYLIKCGVDTREPDRQKNTPLHMACMYGRVKNVELLLSNDKYSNIKCKNKEGNSPLHLAAMYGHLDCVKLLIEKGLKIALPGNNQQRILHFAAAHNHEELAKWILENKGRVNCADKFKRSPLIHAIKNGNLRMASILLQNGADFNQHDSSKNYPIHYAAAYGFQECIELLVQAGADLNVVNSWNLSALCVAMQKNHFGCVKKLVSYEKTDVNCKDDQGRTMISLSLDNLDESMLERIKFLIQKKADCNIADIHGLTPLMYACKMKGQNIANLHPDWPVPQAPQQYYQIQQQFPQANQEDPEDIKQKKAKCIADCEKLIMDVIKLFLDNGADINKIGLELQTAFSVSLEQQNYEILDLLLENKNLDLLKVKSKSQGNIYHLLASQINNKPVFGLFNKVYEKVQNQKNILNQIDSEGYVPILRLLESFNFYNDILIQNPENRLVDKYFELITFMTQKAGADITQRVGKLLKYREGTDKRKKSSSQAKDEKKEEEQKMQIEQNEPQNLEKEGGDMKDEQKEKPLEEEQAAEKDGEDEDDEEEGNAEELQKQQADQPEEELQEDTEGSEEVEEEVDEPIENNNQEINSEVDENEDSLDNYDEVAELNRKENDPYGPKGLQNAWHIALSHGCCYDRLIPWLAQFKNLNINEQDKLQRTPLHIICQFHKIKIDLLDNPLKLQQLFDLGATQSINVEDINKCTPLYYLVQFQPINSIDQIQAMIDIGANVTAKNKEGISIIIQAVIQKKYQFLSPMVKAGAEINQTYIKYKKVKDKEGKEKEEIDEVTIPLIQVVKERSELWVKTLLQLNADPNYKDPFGRTALHHSLNGSSADANASFEIERLLLKFGAKINERDNDQRVPMHYSFVKIDQPLEFSDIDPFESVSSLCGSNETDVNIKDKFGRTPLHYACQRGSVISGRYLIKRGAHIDVTDQNGNTPLGIAFLTKHSNIATILIDNKADVCKKVFIDEADKSTTIFNKFDKDGLLQDTVQLEEEKIQKNEQPQPNNFNQFGLFPPAQAQQQYGQPIFGQQWGYQNAQAGMGKVGRKKLAKKAMPTNEQDEQDEKKEIDPKLLKKGQFTMFSLAIKYGWQGICYLLVEYNYNLLDAVQDSMMANKFNLVRSLLYKYPDRKEILEFNEKKQNLFHVLAMKGKSCEQAIAEQLYEDLKSRGLSIISKDTYNKTAMHYASESNFTFLLEQILKDYPDQLNIQDSFGKTPLIYASECGFNIHNTAEYLLKMKADPNIQDKTGRTALHYSAESGNFYCVSRLLGYNSNINIADKDNISPIAAAILKENWLMALKLINVGDQQPILQIMFPAKCDGNKLIKTTILNYICSKYIQAEKLKKIENDEDQPQLAEPLLLNYIKAFINKGSSINEQDERGYNPLINAIRQNSIEIVRLLLENKDLDINHVDNQGKNAIHHVVNPIEYGSYENVEILDLLMKNNCNFNQQDSMSRTPLDYAKLQESFTLKNALEKAGATFNPKLGLKRAPTSIINIATWPEEELDYEIDAKNYIEEKQKKEKIVEKETIIEPDTQVAQKEQTKVVYDPKLGPYDLMMTKVDVKNGYYGENVFYKMQVLHQINRDVYILFTRYGRIGDMGQYQQTPYNSKDDAIKEFLKIFKDKSGNEWENKDNFVKKPRKYMLLKQKKQTKYKDYMEEIDYTDQKIPSASIDKEIQTLMKDIILIKSFQSIINNSEIDSDIMNISSLQKSTLVEALELMNEASELTTQLQKERQNYASMDLEKIQNIEDKIVELSNRFYELIPHKSYNTQAIPSINNPNAVQQKINLVEQLIEMEQVTKILLGAIKNKYQLNPLQYCFTALNIRMIQLEKNHAEFQLIQQYLENGYGDCINNKKFVNNIFALERKGEPERMMQNAHYNNKFILWHGTKNSNLMSILAHGLLPAPAYSKANGSLFGKGIYFTDAFQKAFSYTSQDYNKMNQNQGFGAYYPHMYNNRSSSKYDEQKDKVYSYVLLCEVALGEILEVLEPRSVSQLQEPYKSVKAIGKSQPNSKKSIILSNGAVVPCGELISMCQNVEEDDQYPRGKAPRKFYKGRGFGNQPVGEVGNIVKDLKNPIPTQEFNEYVVYDASQVRIRYIVQCNLEQQ